LQSGQSSPSPIQPRPLQRGQTFIASAFHVERPLPSRPAGAAHCPFAPVLEGRGRAHVGGQIFIFKPHDIFVIPNWPWTTLEADEDSVLFSFSDRAPLAKLGLFREQRGNEALRVVICCLFLFSGKPQRMRDDLAEGDEIGLAR
jgi:hypothetical protein